jgi:hypothetical protein
MSKKATRRAARGAFPKAGSAKKSSAQGKKTQPADPRLRPPSLRSSAIQSAVLIAIYLLVVRFILKLPLAPLGYVIYGVAFFIFFTYVNYLMSKWTYKRRLQKLKGKK